MFIYKKQSLLFLIKKSINFIEIFSHRKLFILFKKSIDFDNCFILKVFIYFLQLPDLYKQFNPNLG